MGGTRTSEKSYNEALILQCRTFSSREHIGMIAAPLLVTTSPTWNGMYIIQVVVGSCLGCLYNKVPGGRRQGKLYVMDRIGALSYSTYMLITWDFL